ncbi:MAG: cobalamin biosynthesis protein CbiX [Actinobacteria bacterium]|nr:MAG: cobalamin biosynthesis protein CbiX [Actinomycetota bacterium]
MRGDETPVVLVAHGSRDPRAAVTIGDLVTTIGTLRPGLPVYASYLDHTLPHPTQVLTALQADGHRRATLVPLLLTDAFHGRVDIPGALAAARGNGLRMDVTITDVLGPRPDDEVDEPLLAGLRRRLEEAGTGWDAVVLAAAGTRDAAARGTVERVAGALGAALGVPCRVGYASAAPPTPGGAVEELRAAGARRVAMATYFLAPGLLYEAAVTSAREAGAVAVAAPLGGATEVARLVLQRVDAATRATRDADPAVVSESA